MCRGLGSSTESHWNCNQSYAAAENIADKIRAKFRLQNASIYTQYFLRVYLVYFRAESSALQSTSWFIISSSGISSYFKQHGNRYTADQSKEHFRFAAWISAWHSAFIIWFTKSVWDCRIHKQMNVAIRMIHSQVSPYSDTIFIIHMHTATSTHS